MSGENNISVLGLSTILIFSHVLCNVKEKILIFYKERNRLFTITTIQSIHKFQIKFKKLQIKFVNDLK